MTWNTTKQLCVCVAW